MAKKWIAAISAFVVILCIVVGGIFIGLSKYYETAFSFGTWINGIYCTGKSIDEVNTELEEDFSYEGLKVRYANGAYVEIPKEEVSYQADFKLALQQYLKEQGKTAWLEHFFGMKDHALNPVVTIQEQELVQWLQNSEIVEEQKSRAPFDVVIEKTEKGYELHDETKNVLNQKLALQYICDAFLQSERTVDLVALGCYQDVIVTNKMKETRAYFELIDAYQKTNIVYAFSDDWEEIVDSSVVSDFLVKDSKGFPQKNEDGELTIDQALVDQYVEDMVLRHNTIGKERTFETTSGDVVVVSGGTYGNQMDEEAEKAYLYQAVCERRQERHLPIFSIKGKSLGRDDIGDTYIEVDMTDQMLYYYIDGKLVVQTPVVTGNMKLKRSTPAGVNYVYLKQRNRVLRGPGYASPVKFWMPVNKGIGLHDSSWRSEYGGDIYLTNGSHGCINTPYDAMAQIYESADIGTPVIMFYKE